MMHTLLYSEMNQAVPGGTTVGSGHEGGGGGGYGGECQVPSPSQWSDPCYSPPSFHSPQHLPVELEKVKEEPFSPPSSVSSYLTLSPSPPTPPHHLSSSSSSSSPSSTVPNPPPPHHGSSPYGRPSSVVGHVIKKDCYESCINLAELLNDNQSLIQLHHHQQTSSPPSSYGAPSPPSSYGAPSPPSSYGAPSPPSSYGGVRGYPDHPLLRGRLEETSAFQHQQKKMGIAPGGGSPSSSSSFEGHQQLHSLNDPMSPSASFRSSSSSSSSSNDGLSFLESLVDVKQEAEDDVSVGSSCGSPAVPSPGGAGGQLGGGGGGEVVMAAAPVSCQRDILETVEMLAQEHNRRDVQRVSDSLNIPRDPAQWTVEDVRAWLKLQASQLNLPPLMLDFWNYGGPSLLKLTEQQFRQLAPIGGELLYAKLEIWREALRSSPKLSISSPSSHHHHTYAFLHHHQLTGGVPPPPPLSPSQEHHHHHHHLMVVSPQHAAHLQHLQQQQQQQQVVHPSGVASPASTLGGGGGAPASPPLPLVPSMPQVPASVAQVNNQQQSTTGPAPPSPQQQQQQGSAATAIYLEEPCLDMAALLQQQQQQPSSANSPKSSSSSSSTSSSSSSSSSHGAHSSSPAATLCSQTDEAYDSEEEVEEETCSTSGGGGGGSGRGGTHIHLWQFLKELLQQPQLYGSCIRWLDRQKGVFKIEDSVRVARLWGKRKNRPAMNYDKLSRSIRQYYKKGIMKKTERSQRLVYQFCHPYCL